MAKDTMVGKLATIQKDMTGILTIVKSLTIKNAKDMIGATEMLTKLVSRRKRIEELRQFFVKPLNDQVKSINTEFKNASIIAIEGEAIVKNKVIGFRKIEAEKLEEQRKKDEEKRRKEFEREQEKLRKQRELEAEKEKKRLEKLELSKKDERAELKRIEDEKNAKAEEAGREELDFDDSDFKQNKTVHSESGSLKIRKQWTFKVVEPSQVPKKFMVIDEKLIRKAVKSGERVIKGVEIFEKEIVGVNT